MTHIAQNTSYLCRDFVESYDINAKVMQGATRGQGFRAFDSRRSMKWPSRSYTLAGGSARSCQSKIGNMKI